MGFAFEVLVFTMGLRDESIKRERAGTYSGLGPCNNPHNRWDARQSVVNRRGDNVAKGDAVSVANNHVR